MSLPAYVSQSATAIGNSANPSQTIPASMKAGNLCFALIDTNSTSSDPGADATSGVTGWTKVNIVHSSNANVGTMVVYCKVLAPSDPGSSSTWTITSAGWVLSYYEYSGGYNAGIAGLLVSSAQANNTAGTTATWATATPGQPSSGAVYFGSAQIGGTATWSNTEPTSTNERTDTSGFSVKDEVRSDTSATGSRTCTISLSQRSICVLVIFPPDMVELTPEPKFVLMKAA